MNKKIIIIITLTLVVLSAVTTFLIKEKNKLNKVDVNFIFENDLPPEIEINSDSFIPEKVTVIVDNVDITELVNIDDQNVNLHQIGTYSIKYYIDYKEKRYEEERYIKVIDTIPPTITLKGQNVTILTNENYVEPGYIVTDNSNEDLMDKVEISNEIDNTKPGNYKVTYKVTDNSGNQSEKIREVTVKKPNIIVATPQKEEKIATPKVNTTEYSNTIKKNKFTKNSITLEGYIKEPLENNIIKFAGDNTYEFAINVENNNYTININVETITNGTYTLYINEEKLLNKITAIERLSRAKVGNKIVTFNYSNQDEVTVTIANHEYLYDILINPGHGGTDTGAVNEYITEKEMNLTISLYEKCRYEAHGLKVYITRNNNDTYSHDFGPSGLTKLHKLGYEMGYYGAVSKIVYSNHHNSIGNNYYSGYEILIPASLTKDELQEELLIVNKWNNIFNLTENHKRFYAKDYDTETPYSKLNGEVYTFKDNYAINRIPYMTANVKSIIFENSYMSNKNEFKWYWLENNWYNISEAKIEVYVTSLGLNYNNDNTSCVL